LSVNLPGEIVTPIALLIVPLIVTSGIQLQTAP